MTQLPHPLKDWNACNACLPNLLIRFIGSYPDFTNRKSYGTRSRFLLVIQDIQNATPIRCESNQPFVTWREYQINQIDWIWDSENYINFIVRSALNIRAGPSDRCHSHRVITHHRTDRYESQIKSENTRVRKIECDSSQHTEHSLTLPNVSACSEVGISGAELATCRRRL